MKKLKRGAVCVITVNGNSKTTACMGLQQGAKVVVLAKHPEYPVWQNINHRQDKGRYVVAYHIDGVSEPVADRCTEGYVMGVHLKQVGHIRDMNAFEKELVFEPWKEGGHY